MIKLNIACGPNMFPFDGWINYDHEDFSSYIKWLKNPTTSIYFKYEQDLSNYVKNGGELKSIVYDLRNGFPMYANNSVDIICYLQSIEHINPFSEVPQFLQECYRMLKPGGILRITTPDLDLLINAYLSGEMDKFAVEQPEFYKIVDPSTKLAMLMYGSSSSTCKWDHYEGHMFLYTKTSITNLLKNIGFNDIVFYNQPGQSKYKTINDEVIDSGGMTHSFICEVTK